MDTIALVVHVFSLQPVFIGSENDCTFKFFLHILNYLLPSTFKRRRRCHGDNMRVLPSYGNL